MSLRVAVVLPRREAFAPAQAGAIALLAHTLARASDTFCPVVIGSPCAAPFGDVAFRPVKAAFGIGSADRRHAAAVAAATADCALIEVHNRPALATRLAVLRPDARVSLFIHNDPLALRGLRDEAGRRRVASLAGIVCVSAWLRDRLAAATPALQASVLPNCLDLATLPAEVPRAPEILFAGRMVADKGADSFVEACARALPDLPGWQACMIGADRFGAAAPRTPFLDALIPRARAAGITLAGYRTRQEVLCAMRRAAIVVAPSRWDEPFGLVALEAMACGAALVCSLRGGMDALAQGVAEPCDPDDPRDLAARLRALAQDPTRRMAMAQKGLVRAAKYDVVQAAIRLDQYRATLLGAASASGLPYMQRQRRQT